jgi:hypothetical protein
MSEARLMLVHRGGTLLDGASIGGRDQYSPLLYRSQGHLKK